MPSARWEYFVEGLARDERRDEVSHILRKLGKEGWELVGVLDQSEDVGLPHKTDARLLIFKRPSSSRSAVKGRDLKAAAKAAADMAALEIDKLADSSATNDERQQRKRRLLKGPKEFRDIRGSRPRSKG